MPGRDPVEIAGLESFARLSRALREAGEQGKGLKKEARRELNRETKPVRKDMRAAIRPALPNRGGLASDVAGSTRFTTSIATGSNPGVRIHARGKRSIRRMNRTGSFRHPVFGRRSIWVNQPPTVRLKNFLDRPFEQARPALQRGVLRAVTNIRNRIIRSTR